ncbi:MAG TPA: TrkA family potassium uptake protein [Solirubrobacteraceae bacterium]|jgi:voltage-gated potassium channel|nr:TrkA family potassium uptake protein [Solirubrobacteraceae bacterium]
MADWSQSGAWNFPGEDGGKERATAALAEREHARREVRLFIRRLCILLCALGAMVIIGTIGFAVIEHVSPAYGFEWTIDTVTTLGSIPDPPDSGGRALKVGLELLGIGTLFYALATVAEFFVSGQLSGVLEERRIEKMISSFTDHYIVCGFGRVGRQVARDLRTAGARFVVIDPNPVNREAALATGAPLIESQPSDDEILKQAGIDRALGVIACVDSDAENIFIALTARELRSDIFIVARASAEDSEKKMLRAGADRVISPYKTSGAEMARVALRPQVGGAFQVADYRMEEIDVSPICEGVGKNIAEIGGPALIVAVRHPNGELVTSPPPQTVLEAGDLIIAMGAPAAVERLERIFQPPRVQSGIRPTIQGI